MTVIINKQYTKKYMKNMDEVFLGQSKPIQSRDHKRAKKVQLKQPVVVSLQMYQSSPPNDELIPTTTQRNVDKNLSVETLIDSNFISNIVSVTNIQEKKVQIACDEEIKQSLESENLRDSIILGSTLTKDPQNTTLVKTTDVSAIQKQDVSQDTIEGSSQALFSKRKEEISIHSGEIQRRKNTLLLNNLTTRRDKSEHKIIPMKLFGYGQNNQTRNHNKLTGYNSEKPKNLKRRRSPDKQIQAAYFPKSLSPEDKKHSQSTFVMTVTPGFTNLPKVQNESMNMSYGQVIDAFNKSDEKTSTFHDKSWKFFGPKNAPENNPGMGGLKQISLKDALTKSQIELFQGKPSLNMSHDDFKNLLSGKNASQNFLKENKKQISKYLSAVMKSEDNMLGYLNFSAEAIPETTKPKNEKITQRAESVKNNRSEEKLPLILRNPVKKQEKNAVTEAHGITNKVMENWLNQTLSDAEHLDIPGVILKPEHKNPISRYQIDRNELTNCGIPNDFVNRIYRCLFVYSVGFYEMINKMIEHSNFKYSLVSRIWKVFAVLLEYCCANDYKLMITKITQEHAHNIEDLHQDFDNKCQDFIDNEKILKQNIAALQKNNQELERDRTNERALRLRLEEEYMQNSKNHEEEVQLRLKFESKLNSMHSQQRETDIKYQRCLDELENARQRLMTQSNQLDVLNKQLLEQMSINQDQSEHNKRLEEEIYIAQQEAKSKVNQMQTTEQRMKLNQDETNKTRYQMGQIQNENSKLKLTIETQENQIKSLNREKETINLMLNEVQAQKDTFATFNKDLKTKYDSQTVNVNASSHKLNNFEETINQKSRQIQVMQDQIEQNTYQIDDLTIQNKNQKLTIENLESVHSSLKEDYDETVEKLHKTNRYRHELEIRYKALQITSEKQDEVIVFKEENIIKLSKTIEDLNSDIKNKDNTIRLLNQELKDCQDELSLKIEQYGIKIDSLQGLIQSERVAKNEWAIKFKQHDTILTQRQQKVMSLEQIIAELRNEISELNIQMQAQNKTLEHERKEREEFETELQFNVKMLQKKERELKDMVQVSRQLEQQRYRQYQSADEEINQMREEVKQQNNQYMMNIEDLEGQLCRLETNYNTLKAKSEQNENKFIKKIRMLDQKIVQEEDRSSMIYEDLRKQFLNKFNEIQLKDFELQQLIERNQQMLIEQTKLKTNIKILKKIKEGEKKQKSERKATEPVQKASAPVQKVGIQSKQNKDNIVGEQSNNNQDNKVGAQSNNNQDNKVGAQSNNNKDNKVGAQSRQATQNFDDKIQSQAQQVNQNMEEDKSQSMPQNLSQIQEQTVYYDQSHDGTEELPAEDQDVDSEESISIMDIQTRDYGVQVNLLVNESINRSQITDIQEPQISPELSEMQREQNNIQKLTEIREMGTQMSFNNTIENKVDTKNTTMNSFKVPIKRLSEMKQKQSENQKDSNGSSEKQTIQSNNLLKKPKMYINTQGQIVDEKGMTLQPKIVNQRENSQSSKKEDSQKRNQEDSSYRKRVSRNELANKKQSVKQGQISDEEDNNVQNEEFVSPVLPPIVKNSNSSDSRKTKIAVFQPNAVANSLDWFPPSQQQNILRFGNPQELEQIHRMVRSSQVLNNSASRGYRMSKDHFEVHNDKQSGQSGKTSKTNQAVISNPKLLISQNDFKDILKDSRKQIIQDKQESLVQTLRTNPESTGEVVLKNIYSTVEIKPEVFVESKQKISVLEKMQSKMKEFEERQPSIIPRKNTDALEEERKKQAIKNNKMKALIKGAQSRV